MSMFCSVSHAARYTHFHSKLVLVVAAAADADAEAAVVPPARPAVICNTIHFAAATAADWGWSWSRRVGNGMQDPRVPAASNAFFSSFASGLPRSAH